MSTQGAIADLLSKIRRYGRRADSSATLTIHVPIDALEAAERELAEIDRRCERVQTLEVLTRELRERAENAEQAIRSWR